jgi:predicted nuclease with TOPRIM domain
MLENKEIISLAEIHGSWAMSEFQSKYFVVNSQVTDYRRVRQALLEIETRVGGKKQIERNMWRTTVQLKLKQEEYENELHPLKKELITVDMDQLNYDISVYKKKLSNIIEEINNFCEIVKTLVPDLPSLETFKEQNPELERDYWVTRMAKQAAMDLLTIGRISQGNMDSIAMMPLRDQEDTIETALKYSATLNKAIGSVDEKIKLEMQQIPANSFNYVQPPKVKSLITVTSENI